VLDPSELDRAGALVRHDVPLAGLTTLRVGGPARLVAECPTTDALIAVIRLLDARGSDALLVGGGSNLLVSDAGVDGVVVLAAADEIEVGPDFVVAAAGANWDTVVAATVAAGMGGLECLSGIPGSAGATPVQNVGAYGVEVASLLRRVRLLDRGTGQVSWVRPAELGFGYRTSVLKGRNPVRPAVVLAVEFGLRPDGLSEPVRYRELAAALDAAEDAQLPAARVRDAVLALRARKGMVLDPCDNDTWSAGSFFTNPVVEASDLPDVLAAITTRTGVTEDTIPRYSAPGGRVKLSAGWLIERAGFPKGYPGAGARARLSTKHTLALTNRGVARASDIIDLARVVRDGVADAFGVTLTPEPVIVGADL
jgi:UDP-N-acetylmuramate dehydrogenase